MGRDRARTCNRESSLAEASLHRRKKLADHSLLLLGRTVCFEIKISGIPMSLNQPNRIRYERELLHRCDFVSGNHFHRPAGASG